MSEKFHGATTAVEWATCRNREMRRRKSWTCSRLQRTVFCSRKEEVRPKNGKWSKVPRSHLLDVASTNLDIHKSGQTVIWLTVLHWKLPDRVLPDLHFLWPTKRGEGAMKTKTRSSLAQGNEIQTFNMSKLKNRCRPMSEKFHGATTAVEWATCRNGEMRIQNLNMQPSSTYSLQQERGSSAQKWQMV